MKFLENENLRKNSFGVWFPGSERMFGTIPGRISRIFDRKFFLGIHVMKQKKIQQEPLDTYLKKKLRGFPKIP